MYQRSSDQQESLKPLEESSIVIVGTIRNGSSKLATQVRILEEAFSDAERLSFFIVESDSTDNTIEELAKISRVKENFSFVSMGPLIPLYPKRTERIAICRNRYLQALNHEKSYSSCDFVVVADMDGVNLLINKNAVNSCWQQAAISWDVCTANQRGPYYDIWALRHPLWSPNDCWEQKRFFQSHGITEFRAINLSVSSRMIVISPSALWIEVESAFGGLAIYRRKVFHPGLRYVGISNAGNEVCEHVSVHNNIRKNGGSIFINPRLINCGVSEHVVTASKTRSLGHWLKCQTKHMAAKFNRLINRIGDFCKKY